MNKLYNKTEHRCITTKYITIREQMGERFFYYFGGHQHWYDFMIFVPFKKSTWLRSG